MKVSSLWSRVRPTSVWAKTSSTIGAEPSGVGAGFGIAYSPEMVGMR